MLLADRIRTLGYTNATRAGISIALKDMIIPPKKQEFLDYARKEVAEIENQYLEGLITDGERYNKVIDIWAEVTEKVAGEMMQQISQEEVTRRRTRTASARRASSRRSTPSTSWPTPAPAAPRSRSASWPVCAA